MASTPMKKKAGTRKLLDKREKAQRTKTMKVGKKK